MPTDLIALWRAQLEEAGFCLADADSFARAVAEQEPKLAETWQAFAQSWFDMPLDTHMADHGRYRRRRHACFSVLEERITLLPPRAHTQALHYNHLNGGIDRWFEPIRDDIASGPLLRAVISVLQRLADSLEASPGPWFCEVHQFRIEANQASAGKPTPEGVHRDGVDYVLVMMVARVNINAGTTHMFNADKQKIGSFTLKQEMECVMLDDHRVFHGVTAVQAKNPALPAYRDVLVVTLKRP
jgi:hypothetical protein